MSRPTPPRYKTGNWPAYNDALLGQSLMARDFDRQVAELQVRASVLNRYTAHGMPVTERLG